MTENSVENPVCKACNANVRPGALFCYNCGSAVAPDLAVETEDIKGAVTSNLGFNGNANTENNSAKYAAPIDRPIDKPAGNFITPPIEKNAPLKDQKLNVQDDKKVKTAATADAAGKSRTQEIKKVEVIWEAPENSSNIWFVVASTILVLFALLILLAMLYIR